MESSMFLDAWVLWTLDVWVSLCLTLSLVKVYTARAWEYIKTFVQYSRHALQRTDDKNGNIYLVTYLESLSVRFKQISEENSDSNAEGDSDAEEVPEKLLPVPNSKVTNRWDSCVESDLIGKYIRKEVDLETIRLVQEKLCDNLISTSRTLSERETKAPMIIAVYANARSASGYCMNLRDKSCQFYAYKTTDLPWTYDNNIANSKVRESRSEYRLKNLVFALLLWQEEILGMGKFSIYTDCTDVNHPNKEDAKIAIFFMEHYTSCLNVIRVNSSPNLSRIYDTDHFARVLQPAADLLSWNLRDFRKFIEIAYGIEHFEGTHLLKRGLADDGRGHVYLERSFRFRSYLDKVGKTIDAMPVVCETCLLKIS